MSLDMMQMSFNFSEQKQEAISSNTLLQLDLCCLGCVRTTYTIIWGIAQFTGHRLRFYQTPIPVKAINYIQANFLFNARETTILHRLPMAQPLSIALNEDTKSPVGIITFSLKSGVVAKWILSSPKRDATVTKYRELEVLNESSVWHYNNQSRLERDEEDVSRVMDTIEGFANPYWRLQPMNASYSKICTSSSYLFGFVECQKKNIGEEIYFFLNVLMIGSWQTIDIYYTLKLSELKEGFDMVDRSCLIKALENFQLDLSVRKWMSVFYQENVSLQS